MARGSRRRERDATDVSNPIDDVALAPSTMPSPIALSPADIIGSIDRREFNPLGSLVDPAFFGGSYVDGITPAGSIAPVALTKQERGTVGNVYGERAGFVHPERIRECVRRKERREVMFALKKRRKGSGARRRRRTVWSDVRC